MKTKFIHINDISEIDTSSTTVYDLNNRYIDSHGKMFSLKYNREKRRIEIIRIIRTPANAADFFQQKMMENKKKTGTDRVRKNTESEVFEEIIHDSDKETHTTEKYEEVKPLSLNTVVESGPKVDATGFTPDNFINLTLEKIKTHRDRLMAVINIINNSQLVLNKGRGDTAEFENIFRNIDIDGIQRIDKILNLHKELVNYPRSISYYAAKLDNNGKKILESLGTDSQRLKFLSMSEFYHSFWHLYRTLQKILTDLSDILDKINTDEIKSLSHTDKQNIDDIKTTTQNTLVEVDEIIENLKKMSTYISEASNF
jgi:hypothetical protein